MLILHEDNHCLAVAKPPALLTQGVPPGIPTLEAQVKAYLKEKYHKSGNVYLGIPHRLDRPVSGVVLFARNTKAARRLAEQFQQRQVTKVYWAAVEGDDGDHDVRLPFAKPVDDVTGLSQAIRVLMGCPFLNGLGARRI